jgi:hypothetical protein
MSKTCNGCSSAKENTVSVPYVVHESEVSRLDRIIKRQWVALIVLICLLFGSFAMFVWYESQFETISYEQDGEGINNVNYGEQGDLNNGAESENQEEAEE